MEDNKTNNDIETIELRAIYKKMQSKRRLYGKVLAIVFVLSCIYIFSIPRYYIADVKLAPEIENSLGGGTLGSIASSFGINLSDAQTSDAITPILYSDLLEDNKFIIDLFDIEVESCDGKIKTNYRDYIKNNQKIAWWNYPIIWLKKFLPKSEDFNIGSTGKFDPYYISKKEDALLEKARANIKINLNEKNYVISITAKAQDPLICRILADSITKRLQSYITDYRTNKARIDVEHYKQLTEEAKREYEKALQHYVGYADANMNIVLESYRVKRDDLENDMQLKYNAYSTLNSQLQIAKAKLQEKTPAFTIIKGASVPVKPAGPKRMLFVLFTFIIAFLVTTIYIVRDDLKKIIAMHG